MFQKFRMCCFKHRFKHYLLHIMADVVVWQFLLIAAISIGSGGSLSSGGSLKEKKHYKLFL